MQLKTDLKFSFNAVLSLRQRNANVNRHALFVLTKKIFFNKKYFSTKNIFYAVTPMTGGTQNEC